jgi:hypothetical protein
MCVIDVIQCMYLYQFNFAFKEQFFFRSMFIMSPLTMYVCSMYVGTQNMYLHYLALIVAIVGTGEY